jgi:SAM-dependent methyltransferase
MDPSYTAEYELFETKHWWHVARLELIHHALDRYVTDPAKTRWLDVGCGTGVLLDSYPRIPNRLGLELDGGSVERGRQKGLDIRQVEPRWDFREYGKFDLVTMCDVIEHVEDDREALGAVREVLNPGGTVLVTVPALQGLWSAHDVRNHHFRRYDRRQLLSRFDPAEWDVRWASYFSSFLLPMIWGFRQVRKWRYGTDPAVAPSDKKFGPPVVDGTLLAIFRAECRCLRVCNMPLGSSLILVARRR